MTNDVSPTIDFKLLELVKKIQTHIESGKIQSFIGIGTHDSGETGVFLGGKHTHMTMLGILTSVQQSFLAIAAQISEQEKEKEANNNGHKE